MASQKSISKNGTSLGSILIGLVLLAAIALAMYFFVKTVDSKIALSVIGLAGAIITASLQYRHAKNRESEARLFNEKQAVYTELIALVSSIFQGVKSKEPLSQEMIVSRLQDIKSKLFVWGSFATIHCLDNMGSLDTEEDERMRAASGIRWLGELLAHIRKDLGHNDPPGSGLEMALGMIVIHDRAKIREML